MKKEEIKRSIDKVVEQLIEERGAMEGYMGNYEVPIYRLVAYRIYKEIDKQLRGK